MSRCAMIMPKVVQQLLAATCGVRFCKIVVGLEDVEENDAGRCWGNAVCSYLKEPYTDLEDDELEALAKEKARTVLAEIYPGYRHFVGANVLRHRGNNTVEIRIYAECCE